MKNKISFLIVIGILSCKNQIDTKAEGEKLMQISRDWSQAAASGDVEKTLDYWSDDAIMMLPNQPNLKGKESLRGMLKASYKMPGFRISWEPQFVEVSKDGTMAYMIEKTQSSINDTLGLPHPETHTAVTVWRKETGGKWKNILEVWNEMH